MIIAIISEPRSGSNNLHRWFRLVLPEYEQVWELVGHTGAGPKRVYYDKEWFDSTKDYVVHEKGFSLNLNNMTRLIESADITVALHREDAKAQIESFVTAKLQEQWGDEYTAPKHIIDNIDTKYIHIKQYFENEKEVFKKFREEHNLKTFTYEDLYYGNKIGELKEYIGVETDTPFPFGNKYRIEPKPVDKLI